MQNELRFEIISDKTKLEKYKPQILNCFERCFDKPLDPKFWDWAYMGNVCGSPIVSLAFDRDRLIGHYAVIPIRLKQSNKILKSCLSMTTMVDSDYRGRGLFVEQAKQVYDELIRAQFDMVVGYPNQNSAHGFKKHLSWKIDEPSEYVISLSGEELFNSECLKKQSQKNDLIQIDLSNDEFMQWRLSKPGQHYERHGDTILKKYQDSYDIVYLGKDYLNELNKKQQYHLLIDNNISDLTNHKKFCYCYGYRSFCDSTELFFKKDLLMSDVF